MKSVRFKDYLVRFLYPWGPGGGGVRAIPIRKDRAAIARGGFGLIEAAAVIGSLAATGYSLSLVTETRRQRSALTAAPAEVRLGDVNEGSDVPFAFTIVNNESRAVVVKETLVPCSCTEVSLPAGTSIGPRGRMEVKGRFHANERRGAYNATFAISYSVERQGEYRPDPGDTLLVPLTVLVRPAVETSRDSVTVSPSSWIDVVLTPGTASSFSIQSVETSDPFIHHELVGSRLDEETQRFEVRLRTDPSQYPDASLRSPRGHWVKLTTNNPPGSIVIDVTIEGFD